MPAMETASAHIPSTGQYKLALACIPPAEYDLWYKAGMVLKSELKQEGLSLWLEWAASSPNFGREAAIRAWGALPGSSRLTFRSLVYWAKKYNAELYKESFPGREDAVLRGWANQGELIIGFFVNKLHMTSPSSGYVWDEPKKLYCSLNKYDLLFMIEDILRDYLEQAGAPDLTRSLTRNYCSQFLTDLYVVFGDAQFEMHLNNKHKFLLPVSPGQVLDLRTGALSARTAAHLFSFELDLEFRPQVTQIKFVDDIMGGDADLVELLQRVLGYCLTADKTEHAIFIFYGEGGNGKSTLTTLLQNVMKDFYTDIPASSLFKSKNHWRGRPTPELSCIQGKRLCVLDQVDEHAKIDGGRFKSLSANTSLNMRDLRSEEKNIKNYSKFILCTKHKPRLDVTSLAIVRRIVFLPFNVKFVDDPRAARERTIVRDLHIDLNDFFSWLVHGAIKYFQAGGFPQHTLATHKDSFVKEQNSLRRFIDERMVEDAPSRIRSSHLYEAYKSWCEPQDLTYNQKNFSCSLKKQGLDVGRSGGYSYLFGYRLNNPTDFGSAAV